ncbi:hypothetical protein HDU98_002501 [Podochytrium sp. JEL0797]|nr:hypothetical protein HDU98_002501 [Podochytrium sp. JEL0797]
MGSTNNINTPEHEMGIIPRVVNQIMNLISMKQTVDPNITFSIRCTFLEIYQEQVRDLLMPTNDAKDITIREDRNGSVTVSGVHEEPVSTAQDLFHCLEAGGAERTTADTNMHMNSSRSHAIFTLILEQRLDTSKILGMHAEEEVLGFASPACSSVSRLMRCSKLHLVDLAGSERVKRTGAEGVRLKESVKINSGLLALGNVISVLGEMSENASNGGVVVPMHVPYRDSKLTRLLQNSLGGNAKTLMLACVSPCEEDYEETLNSVKYADRARKIQNQPMINTVDYQAVRLASMQERIDFLESQLKNQPASQMKDRTILDSPPNSQPLLADSKEIALADMDNDNLISYFVEELKNRTIRGTNAIRALQDSNCENQRLVDRITDLEERLHTSRLTTESSSKRLEKREETIQQLHTSNTAINGDLTTTLDSLEAIIELFATSMSDSAVNIWKRVQNTIGDSIWNKLNAVCELHRPSLIPSSEAKECMFPVISAVAPPSKPKSRGNSGRSRFNRRASKIVPTTDIPELPADPAHPESLPLEKDLTTFHQSHATLLDQLAILQQEHMCTQSLLEDKTQLVETLRDLNHDLESRMKALESFKARVSTEGTQTEFAGDVAVAAESFDRPYKAFSVQELIQKMVDENTRLEALGESNAVACFGAEFVMEPMENLESIKLLAQLADEPQVSDQLDPFPVHHETTSPYEHEGAMVASAASAASEEYSEAKKQLLGELQTTLKAKAELQRELAVRSKEMEKLKHQHNERVLKMEKDLDAVNRDLTRTVGELQEVTLSKDRLKEEHEKKLKLLENQMAKTKLRVKEQDRIIKDKESMDRKSADVQQEMEKLQVTLTNARKKAKEDAEKVTELETRHLKDVSALTRARDEDAKKMRHLEASVQLVRKRLDKKDEELAALSKKWKDGLAVAKVSSMSKGGAGKLKGGVGKEERFG